MTATPRLRYFITGATAGIGLAAARRLAAPVADGGEGAEVVLGVRNVAKAEALADSIPGCRIVELDLADLASVRSIRERYYEPIDVLIHNAGVVSPSRKRTVDGYELDFGTNFLGPYALTAELLDLVRRRIVIVGSDAHKFGQLDFDDLQWTRRRFSAMPAYGASKLADMLFGYELGRRQQRVEVMLCHPGWAATDLPRATSSDRLNTLLVRGSGLIAQSSDAGAACTVYAATAPIPNGSYVGPDGFAGQWGKPALVGRARRAHDPEIAERLWDVAEQLTGSTITL